MGFSAKRLEGKRENYFSSPTSEWMKHILGKKGAFLQGHEGAPFLTTGHIFQLAFCLEDIKFPSSLGLNEGVPSWVSQRDEREVTSLTANKDTSVRHQFSENKNIYRVMKFTMQNLPWAYKSTQQRYTKGHFIYLILA